MNGINIQAGIFMWYVGLWSYYNFDNSPAAVRNGHAMASALKVRWYAVYVARPEVRVSERDEAALAKTFARARSLGARIVRVQGTNLADAVIDFARKEHVTRIVAGKPTHSRWVDALFGSQLDELIRKSGDIDIHLVASPEGSRLFRAAADFAPSASDAEPTVGIVSPGAAGIERAGGVRRAAPSGIAVAGAL